MRTFCLRLLFDLDNFQLKATIIAQYLITVFKYLLLYSNDWIPYFEYFIT